MIGPYLTIDNEEDQECTLSIPHIVAIVKNQSAAGCEILMAGNIVYKTFTAYDDVLASISVSSAPRRMQQSVELDT